jgi:lysozyme
LNTGVEPKQAKFWKMELGENKMQISQEGLALIKKFEGCELEAYKCPAGVWTIGYGHTKDVKEGDKINKDEADYLLQEEMIEYESYINDMVDVDLNQSQYDSMCAWVYNLGPSNLGSSTMLRVLNEGKYDEVPQQMKRWNKANGEVLDGLIRRREAEALLFQGKEWSEV